MACLNCIQCECVSEPTPHEKALATALAATRAEGESLKAQRDRLEAKLGPLLESLDNDLGWTCELEEVPKRYKQELDALKAQLAEAYSDGEHFKTERNRAERERNGLEEALSIERTRYAAAEERLRVAQEAAEFGIKAAEAKTTYPYWVAKAKEWRAALSTSAPKAELKCGYSFNGKCACGDGLSCGEECCR